MARINIELLKYDFFRFTVSRGFSLTLASIILSSLYIIPAKDAQYCIIKANGFIGYPNDLWMATTVAISSTFIIATTTFFFLDGSYTLEANQSLFDLLQSTSIPNEDYLLTRTATYFTIAFTFLLSLVVTILIPQISSIWAEQFNVIAFIMIIFYISTPGLLFFSIILSLIEHFILTRVWRIIIYILIVCIVLLFSHHLVSPFIDFLGYFEIRNAVQQILIYKNGFGTNALLSFGVLPIESTIGTFRMSSVHTSYYFWTKLITLTILLASLITLGKKKFEKFSLSIDSRSATGAHEPKMMKEMAGSKWTLASFGSPVSVNIVASCLQLFVHEFTLITAFINWKSVAVIAILSLSTCFLNEQIAFHYLFPIVFLLLMPLFTKYMTYQDELGIRPLIVATKTGYPLGLVIRYLAVCIIVTIFLLPPVLRMPFHAAGVKIGELLFITSCSIALSILNVKSLNSTKLFEIAFIIFNMVLIFIK